MPLGDMALPIPEPAAHRLLLGRRTFCTFHGLLRWARSAVTGISKGLDHAFDHSALDVTGEHLLIRLSMLPQELISKIATLANLQHHTL